MAFIIQASDVLVPHSSITHLHRNLVPGWVAFRPLGHDGLNWFQSVEQFFLDLAAPLKSITKLQSCLYWQTGDPPAPERCRARRRLYSTPLNSREGGNVFCSISQTRICSIGNGNETRPIGIPSFENKVLQRESERAVSSLKAKNEIEKNRPESFV